MSDFSTVTIDDGCGIFPKQVWGDSFQSKDFPDHESDTACIDGVIRSDGLFIRCDEKWNPSLNGWLGMRSSFGPDVFFCIRFSGGLVVEVEERRMPIDFIGPMAWESPNDWRDVPVTL